jgi:hypothetical protein
MRITNVLRLLLLSGVIFNVVLPAKSSAADPPAQGTSKQIDLGADVSLEVLYIPPGKFMMGSTP